MLGDKELAKFLVDEIQEVYRLQGVRINDKHIETIVRQMLRRVKIKQVGDANFLIDEQVEKWVFVEENARVVNSTSFCWTTCLKMTALTLMYSKWYISAAVRQLVTNALIWKATFS